MRLSSRHCCAIQVCGDACRHRFQNERPATSASSLAVQQRLLLAGFFDPFQRLQNFAIGQAGHHDPRGPSSHGRHRVLRLVSAGVGRPFAGVGEWGRKGPRSPSKPIPLCQSCEVGIKSRNVNDSRCYSVIERDLPPVSGVVVHQDDTGVANRIAQTAFAGDLAELRVAAALDKPHQAAINESITCAVARLT